MKSYIKTTKIWSMIVLSWLVVGFLVSSFLSGTVQEQPEQPEQVSPRNDLSSSKPSFEAREYEIHITRVIDGDTLICDVNLGLNVYLKDVEVRCLGYDACETSKRRSAKDVVITEAEISRGKLAKQDLEILVKTEKAYGVFEKSTDPYGRYNANVRIGDILLENWAKSNNFIR